MTQTNEAMQGRGEFASRDNRTFLASMLTSLLAVAICSYGIVFMQNRVANEGARATTSAVTQVIAYNLAAPVAFGDMDAARDVLASLESRPDIKAVKILDHRDAVLSIYVPGKTDLSFYRRAAAYKDLIAEDAHLSTAPIELDDEVLGRLEIVSKDTVQGQIHDAGREFAVLIAAFALACSFCLSSIIFLVLRTNAAKAEELTPEPQLSPARES